MQVLTGDWVGVESFRVNATLGVLDWEQRTTQAVDIEIAMHLDLSTSGEEDALDATINYASVADQVRFMLEKGRWRLLESLGLAVCRLLLTPPLAREERASLAEVMIRMAKPEVLSGNPVPWVSMHRAGPMPCETIELGESAVAALLVATPNTTAWRVDVEAGGTWVAPKGISLLRLAGGLPGNPLSPKTDRSVYPAETGVTYLAVGNGPGVSLIKQ